MEKFRIAAKKFEKNLIELIKGGLNEYKIIEELI